MIRLIKLKIGDIWRIGASSLSLTDERDKYAYLRVIGHAMATSCNQTDRYKMNKIATFGQVVFVILCKSKRDATPPTSLRTITQFHN